MKKETLLFLKEQNNYKFEQIKPKVLFSHPLKEAKHRLLQKISALLLFLSLALSINAQITKGSPNNFITVWDTENTTNIIIPTNGGGYNYHVYWEQENNPAINGTLLNQTGNATISGLQPNTRYRVEIAGIFPQFYMYFDNTLRTKLRTITQWGTIPWRSMEYAFSGCINLDITATDVPDLNNVTSLAYMFYVCSNLTGVGANWNWNTSKVKSMHYMFAYASGFNCYIGGWDTKEVENMAMMFREATSFNQSIENWNTSNVFTMRYMFDGAISFNQDISKWDTFNVEDMGWMFNNAITFNQPIGKWNTHKVSRMNYMFYNATNFNKDLSGWDISNIWGNFWEVGLYDMFSNSGMDCTNYSSTLVGWAANPSTPNAITLGADGRTYSSSAVAARNALISKGWTITDAGMIEICPGSPNNFITVWDTENTTNIIIPTTGGGYNYHVYWEQENNPAINGTLLNQTGNATISGLQPNTRYRVEIAGTFPQFYMTTLNTQRTKLRTINQWGTISWRSMEYAFGGCINLDITATDVPDLSNLTSLAYMFSGCSSLTGIGANWNWNTSNVTNMSNMFYNASSFNQPIGDWNTRKVTDMSWMFTRARNFNQPIGDWITSEVTNMRCMFYEASSFNQPIGNWNTSNVTNMSSMFQVASNFNQPIGNWNTSKVTNMSWMFSYSGMDCANYSSTLVGWAANPSTPNSITLGADGRTYSSSAVAARNALISKGWTITGDNIVNAGTLSGTQTICVGNTTSFSSSITGGTWSSSHTNIATVHPATGVVTGVSAGQATISYTRIVSSGCEAVATRTITINALPTAPTVGTITQPSCTSPTGSVVLSGLPTGSWTITRTPGNITTTGTTTSTTLTGLPAGATYTFTVSNGTCTLASSGNVVINAVPTAPVLAGETAVCVASTANVTPSTAGTWTSSQPAFATVSNAGVVTGVAAGTAVLTYTRTSDGCSATRNITITARPTAPTVGTITQPSCTSPTGSVVLSGLPTGSWTITRTPGNITTTGTTTSTTLTGLPAGATYTFTVSNGTCTSASSGNVVINAVPIAPAIPTIASVTQPSCTVSTGAITISSQSGVEYSINNGTSYQSSPVFIGLLPNAYTLRVRSVGNPTCSTVATNTVSINNVPISTVSVVATAQSIRCHGSADGSIHFTAQGGIGTLTATLRNAQNQIVDTKTVTQNVATSFTNLSAGTYTLLITDSNGCTAQPAVNEFIIVEPSPIVWQLPTQTITLCKGQQISYDITQLPSLQATYKWYKNNVLVSSLPTYTLSEKGNYRVVITTASLCEQTHSFDVQASSSIIASEFLMASTAKKNEPVKLINISNAPIETATWVLPNLPAVSFTNKDMYGIDLLFDAFGTYTIGLKTTVGQCELVLYKNIRIVPDNELNDYPQEKEAFLKKFIVSPNPSNGNFEVTIEFSEVTDVVLSIVDVNTGKLMNKRSLKGNHWYKQAYTPFLPQGHYIVYLHTHKAQSAFKLIIK